MASSYLYSLYSLRQSRHSVNKSVLTRLVCSGITIRSKLLLVRVRDKHSLSPPAAVDAAALLLFGLWRCSSSWWRINTQLGSQCFYWVSLNLLSVIHVCDLLWVSGSILCLSTFPQQPTTGINQGWSPSVLPVSKLLCFLSRFFFLRIILLFVTIIYYS